MNILRTDNSEHISNNDNQLSERYNVRYQKITNNDKGQRVARSLDVTQLKNRLETPQKEKILRCTFLTSKKE